MEKGMEKVVMLGDSLDYRGCTRLSYLLIVFQSLRLVMMVEVESVDD